MPKDGSGWKLVDKLFDKYRENEEHDRIGPEGVEKLCKALSLKVTDAAILRLAWKLNAAEQGYFTREEWRSGMKSMGVTSLAKLKAGVMALKAEVEQSEDSFRDYFIYAFRFNLTEPRHKTLDMETACQMLQVVIGENTHAQSLISFFRQQTEYAGMTLDQWLGVLRFCRHVAPDLSNYDDDCSWPSLLDNYVSFAKEKAPGASKQARLS